MSYCVRICSITLNCSRGSKTKKASKIWEMYSCKTGVVNDPLCQPTVRAGLIFKFWDRRTYGLKDNLCKNSDHYRP